MVSILLNIFPEDTTKKHLIFITIFSVLSGLSLSLIIYKISFLKTLFLLVAFTGILLIFRFPDIGVALSFSSAIFKEWLTGIIPIFAAFDFTIAIFGLTFISIMFSIIKNGTIFEITFHKSFLPLLLFTTFLIFSTFYTSSFNYGNLKAFSFLTFNLGLFIAPIFVINEEKYAWRMIYFLIAIGVVITAYSLFNLINSILTLSIIYTFRSTFLGVNSIGFANWVGSINILLITIFPTIRENKWKRIALSVIFLFGIAMLVTNSRGPMLSFMLTGLILFLIRVKEIPARKIALIIFSLVLFLIIVINILPPQLIDRYVGVFDQGQNVSKRVAFYTVSTRLDFWKASLNSASNSISNLFFGIGSGGFSTLYYNKDFIWYPHNIFLEVLCELGLIGLVLLCWHFISIFKDGINTLLKKLPYKQMNLLLAYILTAFFNLLSAQFSGDLNRNRRIWFFLGTVIALTTLINKKLESRKKYE